MDKIKDKILICCDCSIQFPFSRGEQEFFNKKGLVNEPKRCPNCRLMMRVMRSGKSLDSISRLTCHHCQGIAMVPFQPTGHKPVYCSSCLKKMQFMDEKEVVNL